MSTCNLQTTGASELTLAGEDTARIDVSLAALLADLPNPVPGNDYLEPWKGVIARVGTLPNEKRLEALGRELENVPGVDVDAVLDRVFAVDPRRPGAQTPAVIPFPFLSTIVDGKRETESGPFATMSLGTILAMKDVRIDWCVDKLIPQEGVAILGGPPGQGKSWMLLDLALAYIAGRPWMGRFRTKGGRVLLVDEESPPALLRHRLLRLVNGCGHLTDQDDLQVALGPGLCLARDASVDRLRNTIAACRPSLVIVDSLIRVHGSEENSASEMAKVFAGVKSLVREFGCSVIFADHQKKPGLGIVSQDLLLRGTTEKVAFVDTLLSLTRKDGALVVEHSKSRFALPVPSFVITIEDRGPDQTVVRVVGDAEEMRQQAREEKAQDLVQRLLADGSWKSRQELAEAARGSGIPVKALDDLLRTLHRQGTVERDDRKSESGRGNKMAFYRKNPVANSVSDFQSTRGAGNGNGIGEPSSGPNGTLWPGSGGETP